MKSIRSSAVLMLLICLFAFSAEAQDSKLKKANACYDKYAFPEAAEAYKKILAKSDIPEAKIKLAECYRLMNMPVEAEYWYEQVVDLAESEPLHRYYYGMSLKANGKFEEAKQAFMEYAQLVPADSRGLRQVEACEQANYFLTDPGIYDVKCTNINSDVADFGPAFYKDGIVFASENDVKYKDKEYNWRALNFLDLFYAEQQGDQPATLNKPSNLKGKPNTWMHEGTVTFTSDNSTMYFTRNSFYKGKIYYDTQGQIAYKMKDDLKTVNLQIFKSTQTGDKWGDIEPLPFNSTDYSVGHPALSPDGQALYFVSDMPGGYGATDIYVSYKSGDSWGQPENLGPEINTEGKEMFPFISEDNILYFASDALPGLGGLDLFSTALSDDGTWVAPENLRYPVNTNADDFAFIIDGENEKGYFSSNRPGCKGDDDIYSFTKLANVLSGIIVNCEDQELIEDASVKLIQDGQIIQKRKTTSNGSFTFPVSPGVQYTVEASKLNYEAGSEEVFVPEDAGGKIEIKIAICPPMEATPTPIPEPISTPIPEPEDTTDQNVVDIVEPELPPEPRTPTPPPPPETTPIVESTPNLPITTPAPPPPPPPIITPYVEPAPAPVYVPINCVVFGRIYNKSTGAPVNGALVKLTNLDDRSSVQSITASDGMYEFEILPESNYTVHATKEKYFTETRTVSTIGHDCMQQRDLALDIGITEIKITPDKPIIISDNGINNNPELPLPILNHIYYDFDKSTIRDDAKIELDKVVAFMHNNPCITIELRSHTDSRGNSSYNKALSERRAQAARDYLVSRGISPARLAAVGYGESQLFNECADGMKCSNAKHQENRRTEFVLTGCNLMGAKYSLPRYYYDTDYHKGRNYYKLSDGSVTFYEPGSTGYGVSSSVNVSSNVGVSDAYYGDGSYKSGTEGGSYAPGGVYYEGPLTQTSGTYTTEGQTPSYGVSSQTYTGSSSTSTSNGSSSSYYSNGSSNAAYTNGSNGSSYSSPSSVGSISSAYSGTTTHSSGSSSYTPTTTTTPSQPQVGISDRTYTANELVGTGSQNASTFYDTYNPNANSVGSSSYNSGSSAMSGSSAEDCCAPGVNNNNNSPIGVGTEYRIQLSTTPSPDLGVYSGLSNVGPIYTEDAGNGVQRIMLGSFKNKMEADAALQQIKNNGFADSYMVIYQDGLRLVR